MALKLAKCGHFYDIIFEFFLSMQQQPLKNVIKLDSFQLGHNPRKLMFFVFVVVGLVVAVVAVVAVVVVGVVVVIVGPKN